MRVKIENEILPLNLLVIVLGIVIIFFPSSVLRLILGLPFVLFFPGYTLIAALFPSRRGITGIERVALSVGLSIAVVPLIGLILNYTAWGIRLEPILYSTASFIFITSIIAWFRRKRLPKEERFDIEFRLGLPGWGTGRWDKALSVVLVITVLGALGTLGYVIATPKMGEQFTEFYILGMEGKTTDYPSDLVVGEEGKVIVGIINHEYEIVSYRMEVTIDEERVTEVGPITLNHEQKWEQEVAFAPTNARPNQKVEFLLYKDGETEPYLEPLRLWVNVTE